MRVTFARLLLISFLPLLMILLMFPLLVTLLALSVTKFLQFHLILTLLAQGGLRSSYFPSFVFLSCIYVLCVLFLFFAPFFLPRLIL